MNQQTIFGQPNRSILLFLVAALSVLPVAFSQCGEVIQNSGSGHITSPYHPSKYPKNANCAWTIKMHMGEGIRLVVDYLDNKETSSSGQGRCYDTLIIFKILPNEQKERVSNYLCGSSVADLEQRIFDVSSTGDDPTVVRIEFKSDYATQLTGFSISYSALCNQTINSISGVLTSPWYPSYFPKNSKCLTKIQVPIGERIAIQFTNFDLGNENIVCDHDYISMTTGDEDSFGYAILGGQQKYCGHENPGEFVTPSNEFSLLFISDDRFQFPGFRLTWGIYEKPTTTTIPTTISTTTTIPTTTTRTSTTTTTPRISTTMTTSLALTTTTSSPSSSTSETTNQQIIFPTPIPIIAYNGTCSTTRLGYTCQYWNTSRPHEPKYTPTPDNHNYCRNPDNDEDGLWCYTTNPNQRWDNCDAENCTTEETTTLASTTTQQQISTTTNSVFISSMLTNKINVLDSQGITETTSTTVTTEISNNDKTTTSTLISSTTDITNPNKTKPIIPIAGRNATPTSQNSWLPYLLVSIGVAIALIGIIAFFIIRRKKKKHEIQGNDVTFHHLHGDEGDFYESRARENTYAEIPFLSTEEANFSARLHQQSPTLPARPPSQESIDSVLVEKLRAVEQDHYNKKHNAQECQEHEENCYAMASDVGCNVQILPNTAGTSNSNQVGGQPTTDTKGNVSTTEQSTSSPAKAPKKKGLSSLFSNNNKKKSHDLDNIFPDAIPASGSQTLPPTKGQESTSKKTPVATPRKNKPVNRQSTETDNVFTEEIVGNHYASPLSIKQKFGFPSTDQPEESNYAVPDEPNIAYKQEFKETEATVDSQTEETKLPCSSFKVHIDPSIIDQKDTHLNEQENAEGFYAIPTSPTVAPENITTIYDQPRSNSDPEAEALNALENSYVSMNSNGNSEPGIYTAMQPQVGLHLDNVSYGL